MHASAADKKASQSCAGNSSSSHCSKGAPNLGCLPTATLFCCSLHLPLTANPGQWSIARFARA
eukprot:871901-Amphidinium_carterae.1